MKKWYKSKTMVVNLLATAAAVLATIANQEWLSDGTAGYILAAMGAVNLVLRLVTKGPVALK
jgi:hypothetical protein